MGVASGCGEQEVGVASGSGWNLWVWLLGVVLRRYIIMWCVYNLYTQSKDSGAGMLMKPVKGHMEVISHLLRVPTQHGNTTE